ncbi:hypothetical protein CoNPh26_CDS0126 [Staphylococcus phage S-CoN_Ph26]|nr:hypothetical protein CoNPh26_CDS0126 [Staphylococcus phage S-CoN_Ph26]
MAKSGGSSNTVDNAPELLLQSDRKSTGANKCVNGLEQILKNKRERFFQRDVSQAQGSRLRLAAYSQGGL